MIDRKPREKEEKDRGKEESEKMRGRERDWNAIKTASRIADLEWRRRGEERREKVER